ncbi:MAG: DUF3472 domain-containing protein [Phycisphaerae bacterium]
MRRASARRPTLPGAAAGTPSRRGSEGRQRQIARERKFRATFENAWVHTDGRWRPLLRARFTASASTTEAKDMIDAGVVTDRFYLQTGGTTTTPLNATVDRPACDGKPPAVPGTVDAP